VPYTYGTTLPYTGTTLPYTAAPTYAYGTVAPTSAVSYIAPATTYYGM